VLTSDGTNASFQAPSGGADPWTTVRLSSDFSTTLATNTAVTGLNFSPSANLDYEIEVRLLLRTATATVGARPGFAWPGGLNDSGGVLMAPNSATAFAFRSFGAAATQNAASTGLPTTTNSHMSVGWAMLRMGASPTGTFQITLASETGGTSVTVRAGSFIRYRSIAP
jgi:hypothetical protein